MSLEEWNFIKKHEIGIDEQILRIATTVASHGYTIVVLFETSHNLKFIAIFVKQPGIVSE